MDEIHDYRIFTICKVLDCDYKQFVSNICANDVGRVATMESTIGYLMHGYKNLSNSPAVILNDERFRNSECYYS